MGLNITKVVGTTKTESVNTNDLLFAILKQLRILNAHMSSITDCEICCEEDLGGEEE